MLGDPYNPELSGREAVRVYDIMRRNDGQVAAIELVLTLPILSSRWWIEAPENSPQDAIDIADALSDCLFNTMTITWNDFLREALLALFYGFMVFEKVWEERNGLLVYRKFASRHPRTIVRFVFDEQGGLAGVVQAGLKPDGTFVTGVEIPIEKLIVFTWREEFGNPEGFSVLRPAYKHWKMKDFLYTVAAVAMERFGVGTPVGKYPPGGDKDMLLKLLMELKSHESAAIVLPEGYDISLLESGQRSLQGVFQDLIEHHDLLIARAVLAQFLNLGAGETGSRAVGQVHSDLFLMSLEGIADWVENTMQRYAINHFVQVNAPDLPYDFYPKLRHVDLKQILNARAIAEAVTQLLDKGALTWQRVDEEYIRNLLSLPELPTEEQTVASNSATYQTPIAPETPDMTIERQRLDSMQDSFQRAMSQHIEQVWTRVQNSIQTIVDEFVKADDLSKGVIIQQLMSLELPNRTDYERLIRDYLFKALTEARAAVAERFNLNIDPQRGIPNAIRTYINVKAATIARQHYEDVRAAIINEALDQLRANLPKERLLPTLQNLFHERMNASFDDLINAADEVIDLLNEAGGNVNA